MAEPDDLRRISGRWMTKVLEISTLHPTLRNVEHASMWLAGDAD